MSTTQELKSTQKDIELLKAMEALQKQKASWAAAKTDELRGGVGPRGEKGEQGIPGVGKNGRDGVDGRDGQDAKAPEIIVGAVTFADHAAASIKKDPNGTYILSIQLPRGERGLPGAASVIPGPRGPAGIDAEPVQPAAVELAVRKHLAANVEKFRGSQGTVGATGLQGETGASGMGAEEIKQLVVLGIIETLQTAGVLGHNERLLVAIRSKLKAKIHELDSRQLSVYTPLVKSVDDLFEEEKKLADNAAVTHGQMSEIIAAAVKAALEKKS